MTGLAPVRWDAVMLGAALCAGLAWQARRDHARARTWREGLLDNCLDSVARGRVRIDRTGWPTLEGDADGCSATVALILDDAGCRKLPVLWLSVTLGVTLPLEAAYDALARQQGTEFYSPATDLPERLPLPSGWPPHVALRSDRALPIPAALAAAGAQLFLASGTKEIVVSPRGVRVISLVAEARRAEYVLLRRARFDLRRLDAVAVRSRVAQAVSLARSLATEADRDQAAA